MIAFRHRDWARSLMVTLALLLVAAGTAAQEEPPSLLEMLDALDQLEQMVLTGDGTASQSARSSLEILIAEAETIGADDVAARARTLRFLAGGSGTDENPSHSGAASIAEPRALTRGSTAYRVLTATLATAGAVSVGSAAVFAYLGDRAYQNYMTTADATTGAQSYRTWKTYDLLSIGFAGGAAFSGIMLPVVFGVAAAPEPTVPTGQGTEGMSVPEIEAEIQHVLATRAELQTQLARADDQSGRRSFLRGLSLVSGTLGAATGAVSYYMGSELYERYQQTQYSADAAALANQIRLADLIGLAGAGVAVTGFTGWAAVDVFGTERGEIETKIRSANARLIELRLRLSEMTR